MSDINQLETEWLTARYAADYQTRRPRYDIDARYRHQVDQMQFQLEKARAEAAAPPAAPANPADIDLLNRAMAADGGKAYFNDAKVRGRIESLRAEVMAGGRIPENVRAATEASVKTWEGA